MNEIRKEMKAGKDIIFSSSGSSGHSENGYGNGSISLHLHTAGAKSPWTDLGQIDFTNPRQDQLEEMATAPFPSEGNTEFVHACRRLSFKQAKFLQEMISDMIMANFAGCFPSDEEIDDFRKKSGV